MYILSNNFVKTVCVFMLVLAMTAFVSIIPRQARAAGLTPTQVNSILELLSAFNADNAVITNVATILGGGEVLGATTEETELSASVVSGNPPLEVEFSLALPATQGTYTVIFGDGKSAPLNIVVSEPCGTSTCSYMTVRHTYMSVGTYDVTLQRITKGVASISKQMTITVSEPPVKFSASPLLGKAPLSVNFKLQSPWPSGFYDVIFGDGKSARMNVIFNGLCGTTTCTYMTVNHTYAKAGTYAVTLQRITKGIASLSKQMTIKVSATSL